MRSKETTVIAAIGMAGSTTTTTTASAQSTTGGCASGLHLILARGTSEEIPGVQGLIADALGDLIPGTTVANLPYPASSEDPFYFESVFNGTMLMRSAVTEYIEACPESKIAVLGYSQGAQITTNAFCGTSDLWVLSQGPTDPLPREEVEKNVIAIGLFGDPTHRHNSFSKGTATGNGAFYRDSTTECEGYGASIASYCDVGDPFCDVTTPFNESSHLSYVQNYGEEVVEWIYDLYTQGAAPDAPGNETASASVSAGVSEPTDEVAGAAQNVPRLAALGVAGVVGVGMM